jgi:hypothetical protein
MKIGRKGFTLSDMSAVAMTLVLIGLAVAFGAMINRSVRDNAFTTVSVGCEAVTAPATNTWSALAYPYIKSVGAVYNGSTCAAALKLGTGNYTVGDSGILWTLTNPDSADKYVNYTTFNTSLADGNGRGVLALENSTAGLGSLAGWLPLIAIVIAAAMIIGIIVKVFNGGDMV